MPTQEVAGTAPHSALLRRGGRRPHRVLLDGGGADSWGRGSALYTDTPVATLTVFASGWSCWRTRASARWRWGDPLALWQAFVDHACGATRDGSGGGVLTVLAYDLKHTIERLARRLPWPAEPLLFSAHYDWSYRAEYGDGRRSISAGDEVALAERLRWYETSGDQEAGAPGFATEPAEARVAAAAGRRGSRPASRQADAAITRDAYLAMVARAHEYIAAGDIYQVNLAQPFIAATPRGDAPALFAAWVERYPMPFAAYVDGGDWTLVSNSPECLLAVDGDAVSTRPIKGTRASATGADRRAGRIAGERLRRDPKERAEHVMIVDLERNDLGRVCRTGSVAVAELGAVRQYPLVVHMESEVRGRLRPGTNLAALLRATFPGGSISGAPKVRAMQIIEELEPAPRGFYTGAIGWTDPDGRSRFSIAIRTAVLGDGRLTYWAGGGIVADSDPEREYQETLLKSETLFRALGALERSRACDRTATFS